jgi:biotin carboxyl carrier protein
MALEIQINDRTATIEKVAEENSIITFKVDGKLYEVDIEMVENGVYSILYNGKSYNVEMIEGRDSKSYFVNTLSGNYELEVVDAERKYKKNRKGGDLDDAAQIVSPMPGKVVKIPVGIGDMVKPGEPVIIISAMKMESEYTVKKERVVKEILVKEGDTVAANQVMVILE